MKFFKLTFMITLIAGFGLLSSCKKGDDPVPTVEQAQLTKLNIPKGWVVSKVTLDVPTNDVTADYIGFKIVVTGTFSADGGIYDYTLSNRPVATTAKPGLKSPWPQNIGKWKFGPNASSTIIRDPDNVLFTQPMEYSVSSDKLVLTFNYIGAGYGSKVDGNWTMEFIPAP